MTVGGIWHIAPADDRTRHIPDRTCKCGPIAGWVELGSGRAVIRHRAPPAPPPPEPYLGKAAGPLPDLAELDRLVEESGG